jgi:hypothetical protein
MPAGFHIGELTSANTEPYLIPFSTTLSIDPLISGVCLCNNSSSLWSDERRDSAFENIISELGWMVAKRRTVVSAENWNTREQRRFPTTTTPALLYQK